MAASLKQILSISHLNEVLQVLSKYQYIETSYYKLGLSLGLSARTLDIIEKEQRGDVGRCLVEVLKKWLNCAEPSKAGDPSYYTLIAALRAIGENAVADGIDREKYPARAILVSHQDKFPSFDNNLLPCLVLLLHKEGVPKEILSVPNSGKELLMSVQEAVCIDYKILKKFAVVLQHFAATMSVSKDILEDYKKNFPDDVDSSEDVTDDEAKHDTRPDVIRQSSVQSGNELLSANKDSENPSPRSSHEDLRPKQSDDTYKVRPPKNIDELLRSVGVVIYSDDDSPPNGLYNGYSSINCKRLKDLISDPSTKVKVKPLLFSLSGLPKSGKTAAFTSFTTHHIYGNPFLPPDMKIRPVAAGAVAHYDLIAVPDSNADGGLLVTEATKEASSVIGILSALKQLLVSTDPDQEGRIPLLDDPRELQQNIFQKRELNEHLQHIYKYIGASSSDLGDEDKAAYADKLSIYPEESALVNIWDIPTNSTVHDILSALQGHLSNNHLALFLDLERDHDKLHKPPSGHGDVNVMEWRPRIHYLLRTCRMSESIEERGNRRGVCTIFAKYDTRKEFQRKITELREEVQSAAQHIGVSRLLDKKIETFGHKKFQILPQKIKKMISKAPAEDVPISWLFLRSMFHLSSKVFIRKDELKALAVECGMDDSSLEKFGKFYTSFGSIFDLSLVNPDAQYVIVKPIHFLKEVNNFFSPKKDKFPTMAYGIVPESAGREELKEDWPAYINSLICLNLATEIASGSIKMPPKVSLDDPNDTYYFISSCRTGPSIKDIDPNSVHLITSINTPVAFNQVTFARLLLKSQPKCQLVACVNRNQTIIRDTSSDTTVTLVSYGPATKLHLSEANTKLCSDVVQAYHDMAKSSPVTVKYKFVKMCVTGETTDAIDLSSAPSHMLSTSFFCKDCHSSGCTDDAILNVWNRVLETRAVPQKSTPTGQLTAWEIPGIAQKIVSHESFDIRVVAETLDFPNFKNDRRFDGLFDKNFVAELISRWQRSQEAVEGGKESRHTFARKLLSLGENLSKDDSLETMKYYEKLASRVDLYYIPKL